MLHSEVQDLIQKKHAYQNYIWLPNSGKILDGGKEKWEKKEEDIEGFQAARGSASGYSSFRPGCLLVLIFSGLCSPCKPLGCLRWATCQWHSSCVSPSGQMVRRQFSSFLPIFSSYNFLSFLPLSPPILSAAGGRATWTSMCLKSKLNSPSNYFPILYTSNSPSPLTNGNCCCTAGLALVKPADEWQAGVMLVWLTSCKEIKEENPAYQLRRA